MSSYRDLKVWEKARVYIKDVYTISSKFPKEEMYGITSQIRRAAVSIANNIVEGSARYSDKEFMRFLDIAYASSIEVENMHFICLDLGFVKEDEFSKLLEQSQEIQRMIFSLKRSLKEKLTTTN
jgi:four helix bundle protein